MFNQLKQQVQQRFKELSTDDTLFYIDIDREKIWELYLNGFDDASERQSHNCNCCKSFLRQYSGIVAIRDNKLMSIWDGFNAAEPYTKSIKNIRDYVLSLPVANVFYNTFDKLGTDQNLDKVRNTVWTHFHLALPAKFVYRDSASIESKLSDLRASKEVFKRSLDELTQDSTETVLEIIAQNSLYRGNEFEGMLNAFLKVQKEYAKVPAGLRDNFAWSNAHKQSGAVARIRNTAIGTLLTDISEGLALDDAVNKFERSTMAPANYKRSTALVSPKMIEDAKEKLNALGYMESLERRFAKVTDIDVNNLLFVDRSSALTDVFDDMKKDAQINPKTLSKTEEISIDAFISDVLPKAKAVYALLENSHLNSMVSLLTASNAEAKGIFKWRNNFSWAYAGDVTDSIKERVKAAGGRVDGVLRFSLQWNEDGRSIVDLDLHAIEPDGTQIYYSSDYRSDRGGRRTRMTGQLDVDMIDPMHVGIENIVWLDQSKMAEGRYLMKVHNFNAKRNNGFRAEIEVAGERYEFAYNKHAQGYIDVAEVHYSKTAGFTVIPKIESSSTLTDKEKWNLKTNRYHKVKQIMLSPNYWSDKIGNKHYFFTLENCASDESTRPFFNEFLNDELSANRKFFELLGSKLKVSPTTTQVAGVGFSDTQRKHVYVRVEGNFKRTLKIKF